MTRRGVAVAIAMALVGCESVPQEAVTRCDNATVVAQSVRTDILFVVDDSGSMGQVQQNLATNFGAFIQRLAASPVRNDYQIGITTTSVDWTIDEGGGHYTVYTRDPTNPSAAPYPAGALVSKSTRPKLMLASSPTLVDDFVANVTVGNTGATKEQGLRAAQLALTDRIADGKNAGLLRAGARLAIVIVSDEDDCSDPATPPAVLYPGPTRPGDASALWGDACHSPAEQARLPAVSQYVESLRTRPLGGETREIVVAIVAGIDPSTAQPKQPACSPSRGYPAFRYKAFAEGFGTGGLAADICQDFGSTLAAVAGLIDPGQTITLEQAPPDGRLLAVSVARANASATTTCKVALDGTPEASAADAVYVAPQQGRSATLTFQNACTLRQGDEVQMRLLCAG